eukprot:4075864-Pyramimonas_sp.AAC.1
MAKAKKVARALQMEGGSFAKCGSRLSAANNRFKHLQKFHGLGAGRFQNVALALAPRKFALNTGMSFTD